jgi:hypothetical protein
MSFIYKQTKNNGIWINKHGHIILYEPRIKKYYFKKANIISSRYYRFQYKHKNFLLHRVLAETFIPNPLNKPQINHKDGNKLNNNINNLEWVTAKENFHHAVRVLKTINIIRTNKINEDIVKSIKQDLNNGYRNITIAKKYNIHQDTVSKIRHNIQWKHI